MEKKNKVNNLKSELSDDDLNDVVGGIYMQTVANLTAKFIKDKIGNLFSNKGFFKTDKEEGR